MPSFLPHLVAPLLFAFAFLPMERKRILLWSPIVFVPDLDYFFAVEYHRALLSNIWIPLIVLTALIVLWQRRDPGARILEFAFRPGAAGALSLVAYYLISHIIMDIFAGGVVLLWPFTELNFYSFFQIVVDTGTNQPVINSETGTEQGIPTVTPRYTWFSTIDMAVLVFCLTAFAAWGGYRFWHRRHYGTPITIERPAHRLD